MLSNISNSLEASVRVSSQVPATWFPVVPCCSGSAEVEQNTERMRSSVRIVLLSGVGRTVSRTVVVLSGAWAGVEGGLERDVGATSD